MVLWSAPCNGMGEVDDDDGVIIEEFLLEETELNSLWCLDKNLDL